MKIIKLRKMLGLKVILHLNLDIDMSVSNLLENNPNYTMASVNLWIYCIGEIDDVNDSTSDGKSFKHKENSRKHTRKTIQTCTSRKCTLPQLAVPRIKY